MAVAHAHTVLHWQENLFDEDMPPEWMWPLVDELDDHFAGVLARRKERYGSGGRDDDDDAPDMLQNELTKGKRR
jgi:hypothetical protein